MASKLLFFGGLIFASLLWRGVHQRIFRRLGVKIPSQALFLVDKLSYYLVFISLWGVALHHLGAELSDILATAGVLTVALGFAAKTSVSNMISGLIMLGTKTIQRDDLIEVGEHLGLIENIDIFSTSLRTFDNVLITIPNEKLITEYITNYSKYPIRRLSCEFIVRTEDITREHIDDLLAVIKELPQLLIEPEPLVVIESVPAQGIKLSFRAWSESSDFIASRNHLVLTIVDFLNEHNIESNGEMRLSQSLPSSKGVS